MTTITRGMLTAPITKKTIKTRESLWTKYIAYADSKSKEGVVSFLKVILIIPCVFMVLSIMAMAEITPNYIWFIAVSMVLFFVNVMAHIGNTKSTFHIPLYHASLLLFILIPIIAYFIYL